MTTVGQQRTFRTVCGEFATGVMVLMAEDGGMTINAFVSLSLDPLLVAVSLHKRSHLAQTLAAPGACFSLSVLSAQQESLARFYSQPRHRRGDDTPGATRPDPRLGPVIENASAWMWCRVKGVVSTGDHWLLIAQAEDFSDHMGPAPLIFHHGRFWDGLGTQGETWLGETLLLER